MWRSRMKPQPENDSYVIFTSQYIENCQVGQEKISVA